ncbi:MAG: imidazole glycerol phosphate synthase subunit HisH [Blastochloris sp.]|nr:imidazole glycerol phosphate synthase subunit HisH [Blastochloris sp.]
MKLGLIDYGRGNLRSVEKALQHVGASVQRVGTAEKFAGVDALVLPGVGSFGDAMGNLHSRNLVAPLQKWLAQDRPFLGICLGYQLLFESGEESPGVAGLGWLKGKVVRFPDSVGKVPHIGWNTLQIPHQENSILAGLEPNPYFYHVHSYYPEMVDEAMVACRTEYGISFVSGVSKGNIHAFQFHPEKSQDNGLKLLDNFVKKF